MSTTIQDLVKQRADLDAQIEAAKAADFHAAVQQCADSNAPVCAAAALYAPARSSNGAPKVLYEGV